ncbi:MAG: DEAD/DEAH box helicase, partial [Deltaproteobacteria bacterium]|nr:DEAD/DEAH box helicase [Deltaproteobacteria bacterium]
EMLMRQQVRRVVICCPPSVVRQWRDEMEQRFGLTVVIYDRDYVAARRQERGYGVNPWSTHSRFIISQALLREETYAAPLRDWLGDFCSSSLLILDEVHNAAPASGARYAIDSKLTHAVRDIAPRFEHRLFLSATPHNGHSNSFAALLEILDPQRFCRGVPVKSPKLLEEVMVRRLKRDLRAVTADFPERQTIKVVVDGLPAEAPELVLSRLLQQYRQLGEERLKGEARSRLSAAMLVVTSLQKRLLSSIEAFHRTLQPHRKAVERAAEAAAAPAPREELDGQLLLEAPGADDERAELDDDEVQADEDAEMEAATRRALDGPRQLEPGKVTCPDGQGWPGPGVERERALLAQMAEIAAKARYQPDTRVLRLIAWIKQNCCPDLGKPGAAWNDRRVLIFTEFTATKTYLQQQLEEAIVGSDQDDRRIDVFHGTVGEERREAIKAAFNMDPARHPLRILIATDAAREGVNLQNHCADLFHFDVPWNPSRMEQRNGRIDRKLQRAPLVRCHYFVLPQRAEDRVLDVLVHKTAIIQKELGSLSPVVERNISRLFAQ